MLLITTALVVFSGTFQTKTDWVDQLRPWIVMDKGEMRPLYVRYSDGKDHVVYVWHRYVALKGLERARAAHMLEQIFPRNEGWVWRSKHADPREFGTFGYANNRNAIHSIVRFSGITEEAWVFKAQRSKGTFFIEKEYPQDPKEALRVIDGGPTP